MQSTKNYLPAFGRVSLHKDKLWKNDLPRTQMTLDLNGKGPSVGRFQKNPKKWRTVTGTIVPGFSKVSDFEAWLPQTFALGGVRLS